MPDIVHRVGIQAAPEKVFAAIATPEGLSQWWITRTFWSAMKAGRCRTM